MKQTFDTQFQTKKKMANNLQRLKEYFDSKDETMPEFKWEQVGSDHQCTWMGELKYKNGKYVSTGSTKREVKEKIASAMLKRINPIEEEKARVEQHKEEGEPGLSEVEELRAEVKRLWKVIRDTNERLENLEKLIDMIDD